MGEMQSEGVYGREGAVMLALKTGLDGMSWMMVRFAEVLVIIFW